MLKLMYITNDPAVAKIAADAGVDRIFIDMEVLGKAERQGGMDTVQSHHTPEDIAKVRAAIGNQAEIMARVNPINPNSQTEIDDAIANGADVIMLPMWRTADDLRQLVRMVNGRAKVMPLLETDTAAEHLPEALAVPGIDQMHIGSTTCTCAIIRNSCSSSWRTARWTGFAPSSVKQVFPMALAAWGVPVRGRFRQNISSVSTIVLVHSM